MKPSHRRNMPFERGSPHPALLLLVAVAVAIATAPGIVKADVLYDSTVFITDEGNWNTSFGPTYIGGMAQFGDVYRDQQGADDFELADTYDITSVTADYVSLGGDPPPADGVLVEFFTQIDDCSYDGGPCPSESPFAAVLSSAVTMKMILPDIFDDAFRLTVDLTDEGITLSPGIWWVSITPVDLTPKIGLAAGQFNSIVDVFGPNNGHFRNGGEDHGNGYPGLYGDITDWTPRSLIGGGGPERDLAMKIEGTLVKPNCPQDLDGDGSVGVSDLLSLLASWGPCKGCPADFDGNGNVGIPDLLALLANWGPCPSNT